MSQPTEVVTERFGLPQAVIDRIAGALATYPAIERATSTSWYLPSCG